jgi:hypothetical protein
MKIYSPFLLVLGLFFFHSTLSSQSLALKLNASLSSISEVEASFISPGISIEGKAGRHYSIGLDLGATSNGTYKMLHFTPSIKYYFGRSLRSFYIGAGIDAFQLKRKNGGPIGYPFDNENNESGIAGGPQLMIGSQTVIDDIIVIGFQLGAGPSPAVESIFFHAVFSAGIVF